jgi:hypothetical protein
MKVGKFASRFEQAIYEQLKKAGLKPEYEPETFSYERRTKQTYCRACGSKSTYRKAKYTPDFRIGEGIYIEAKGYLKAEVRAKMEDFLSSNAGFDLRFIFGADNWLTRKRLKKYSDWARSLGVPYALKEVPESWIQEAKRQSKTGKRQSLQTDADTAI